MCVCVRRVCCVVLKHSRAKEQMRRGANVFEFFGVVLRCMHADFVIVLTIGVNEFGFGK